MAWPVFDTQDDIPETFRGEYEERDGKWHAKVPDVDTLESTLGKVRKEAKEAEKRAKEAEEQRADLQRQMDAVKIKGDDVDKRVAEALAKWEKDKDAAVAKERERAESAEQELRKVQLDERAKEAFIEAGGRPERASAAMRHGGERLDLVDGRVVVKDEQGDVTNTPLADYWGKTFRKEMPEFFAGTKADGGGAHGIKRGKVSGDEPTDWLKFPERAMEAANQE